MDDLNKGLTIIELLLILLVIGAVWKGLSALQNLFGGLQNLFGDKVATIDPATGLPIDPATGKPDSGTGKQLTPEQWATVRATFCPCPDGQQSTTETTCPICPVQMYPQGA